MKKKRSREKVCTFSQKLNYRPQAWKKKKKKNWPRAGIEPRTFGIWATDANHYANGATDEILCQSMKFILLYGAPVMFFAPVRILVKLLRKWPFWGCFEAVVRLECQLKNIGCPCLSPALFLNHLFEFRRKQSKNKSCIEFENAGRRSIS